MERFEAFIKTQYEKWKIKFVIVVVLITLILIFALIYLFFPDSAKHIIAYIKYYTYDTLHTQTSYFFNAGVKYEEMGLYNLAIGSFKRALHYKGETFSINPADPYQRESLYNLGVIYYMRKQDYSRTIHYFNKYLEISRDAITEERKRDIYKVINYILSLDDKTKNVEAKKYKSLGNEFYFRNEYKKAIEYYMKAIALDPGYVEVYNNLASTYLQLEDFKNAIKYWKITLMFDPNELDLYINVALALEEKLKEYEEAIYYYEQFLERAGKQDRRVPLVMKKIETLKAKFSRGK